MMRSIETRNIRPDFQSNPTNTENAGSTRRNRHEDSSKIIIKNKNKKRLLLSNREVPQWRTAGLAKSSWSKSFLASKLVPQPEASHLNGVFYAPDML
jgi:hypothetical protein